MCWELFLDDESLLKFQAEQKAVHVRRMAAEGAPGYVDKVVGRELQLTLFEEGGERARQLKPGQQVRVSPAGVDRKPTGTAVTAEIATAQMAGPVCKVTLTLDGEPQGFQPSALARVSISP